MEKKEQYAAVVLADMGVGRAVRTWRGYIERFISTPGNVMLDSSVNIQNERTGPGKVQAREAKVSSGG